MVLMAQSSVSPDRKAMKVYKKCICYCILAAAALFKHQLSLCIYALTIFPQHIDDINDYLFSEPCQDDSWDLSVHTVARSFKKRPPKSRDTVLCSRKQTYLNYSHRHLCVTKRHIYDQFAHMAFLYETRGLCNMKGNFLFKWRDI